MATNIRLATPWLTSQANPACTITLMRHLAGVLSLRRQQLSKTRQGFGISLIFCCAPAIGIFIKFSIAARLKAWWMECLLA